MWPAENIMRSMWPAKLFRFPTPALYLQLSLVRYLAGRAVLRVAQKSFVVTGSIQRYRADCIRHLPAAACLFEKRKLTLQLMLPLNFICCRRKY